MDPSMRVTEQTSELAKTIAKFSRDEIGVEVSPIMVDNALRGYFGSSAALLTMTTDSLLNPTRIDRPLHKYALLSTYLYDPVGTRRMTEFYEEREKVGKANTTLRELMKTDIDRAEKYAEAHQMELAMESAINSTLEQLERTRAYRKFLNSPDGAAEMSKEEREADLKEVKRAELEYVNWVREAKAELRKEQGQ
jgi:tryptophan synthase alpha subunit